MKGAWTSVIIGVIITIGIILFILMVLGIVHVPFPGIEQQVSQASFCSQLQALGCAAEYLDEATYAMQVSKVKCSQIGKSSCVGGEYATFGEVCEYFGKAWDECLGMCGCKTVS